MSTNEAFAILGLTGGIASGKSTVAEMFRDRGVRVIDADVLAREVVQPGEPALEEIREEFGDRVLDDAGELDREELAAIVFDDEEARERLDAITHPRIARRMQRRAAAARRDGEPWVLYDAALIVENDLHDAFEALLVVAAGRETQIDRLRRRDGLDRREAERRIDAQLPLSEKVAAADWVVDNDGSLEATRAQVDRLYERIDEGLRRLGAADRASLVEAGLADPDELA